MTPDTTVHLVRVVDSHTGGEPTRVVVAGGPELPPVSMAECRELLRSRHDQFRSAIINEPRGSEALVGALLLPPVDPQCAAGVVFFNNVGYIGMCGHGTIGLAVTLAHLGRIRQGRFLLETPVGIVSVDYHGHHRATVENVPSFRHRHGVTVDVEDYGPVTGDIAWGGNWFFLTGDHGQTIEPSRIPDLMNFTHRLRSALQRDSITGGDGGRIDHLELCGPPSSAQADCKNFVLCPGGAYDRSPCGTGTSAKVACLAADGQLQPGQLWRQEGVLGTIFEARYRSDGTHLIPSITGEAYVTAEATLLIDPHDPFAWGI